MASQICHHQLADDELIPRLALLVPPKVSPPSKSLKERLGGEEKATSVFETLFLALVKTPNADVLQIAQQLHPAFAKPTAAVRKLLQRVAEAAEPVAEALGSVTPTYLGFATQSVSASCSTAFLILAEKLPTKKQSYEAHYLKLYELAAEEATVCLAFPYAGVSSACVLRWPPELHSRHQARLAKPPLAIVDIELSGAQRLLQLKEEFIGADISRKDAVEAVSQWCSKHRKHKNPMQLFLHDKRSADTSGALVDEEGRAAIQKQLKRAGNKLFIHAPYQLSLTKKESPKHEILSQNLRWGDMIGAKGVVIHTDSWKWFERESDGETAFLSSVRRMAHTASPTCPLLVETPAKQGKELLGCLKKFQAFCEKLSGEERLTVGVCVDTCHLFAAGYRPLEYIEALDAALPGIIKLIHFNGSEKPFGSRVDRHAGDWTHQAVSVREEAPLSTHVPANLLPLSWLLEVAEWAVSRSVPMVTERG